MSACETGEPGYVCVPADVRAVHDEDDGVAGGVVGLPEVAHCELPADVPDLEVHVGQGYNRDVLADCGDCFAQGGGGIGGGVRDSRVLPVSGLKGSGVKEAVEWVRTRVKWNKEGRPPVMR